MADISLAVLIGLIPTSFVMGMGAEAGKDMYQWIKKRRLHAKSILNLKEVNKNGETSKEEGINRRIS